MTHADVRRGCRGLTPLSGRLEDWQAELCRRPELLGAWIEEHGSPINLIDPRPMERNATELADAAAAHGIELKILFARKANKCLALVDAGAGLGLGVDVAGERELTQTLGRGLDPADLVMTAAVKPEGLLRFCAETAITVVIDNEDELRRLAAVAPPPGAVPVAMRLAPTPVPGASPTRFGLGFDEALAVVDRHRDEERPDGPRILIDGVHFHLDGYDPDARVAAIGESLELIDALRERGHDPSFVDIGGGIPISYLESGEEWERFWTEHRRALNGQRPELTYEGHGLGLIAAATEGAEVRGRPNVYPYHQPLVRGAWLDRVLAAPVAGAGRSTVAEAIAGRGLELRCEPGRSLLDGCGMTVARVEFRKRRSDGTWLVGLAMNRTQCRSTSDDFLVDPLLIEPGAEIPGVAAGERTGGIEAYLVGAYCIERELLTWRKLSFPLGVGVGDLIAFPNTAGYLMHILESSSHQIPLARNLIVGAGEATLDPIDGGEWSYGTSGVAVMSSASAPGDS